MGIYPYFLKIRRTVSKIRSRFRISAGEKSRVPFGMEGFIGEKTKDKSKKTKVRKLGESL